MARGHRHVHASGWADLLARRCSRRAGRSSEPGCEAGTHPRDGQSRTLSSARPHRSGKHDCNSSAAAAFSFSGAVFLSAAAFLTARLSVAALRATLFFAASFSAAAFSLALFSSKYLHRACAMVSAGGAKGAASSAASSGKAPQRKAVSSAASTRSASSQRRLSIQANDFPPVARRDCRAAANHSCFEDSIQLGANCCKTSSSSFLLRSPWSCTARLLVSDEQ